ncbi:hypothetical protein DL93DRAFT_2084763, partial [Clavulina sp. PMI_390]
IARTLLESLGEFDGCLDFSGSFRNCLRDASDCMRGFVLLNRSLADHLFARSAFQLHLIQSVHESISCSRSGGINVDRRYLRDASWFTSTLCTGHALEDNAGDRAETTNMKSPLLSPILRLEDDCQRVVVVWPKYPTSPHIRDLLHCFITS